MKHNYNALTKVQKTMRKPKQKTTEPVKRTAYAATLRSMEMGETRTFDLVGADLGGFSAAKTRLTRKGYEFEFSRNGNQLTVTRR
jgi:hypothetical protein